MLSISFIPLESEAKSLSMVEKTPDDVPDDSPVPPKFPGQSYRDRNLSPNSEDDSDSGPKSISLFPSCAIFTNDDNRGHRTRSQETRRSKPVSRAPSRESFPHTGPTGDEPTGLKTRNCARYSCFSTQHDPQGLTGSGSFNTYLFTEPSSQQGLAGSGETQHYSSGLLLPKDLGAHPTYAHAYTSSLAYSSSLAY